MQLDFYKPKNEILKKYIEGYYFISPSQKHQPITYWTFPNNYFIVSVNVGANIDMKERSIIISNSGKDNITSDFVTHYTSPIEVIYSDAVAEITIYFKPTGINHFVDKADKFFKEKNALDFNPYFDFDEVMKRIFTLEDRTHQIEMFEQFWLSKFLQKDLQLIEQILLDLESEMSIVEVATKYNISRQYLNTLCVKYIGKSPSEYRKIHRFRAALQRKKDTKNLTHLTFDSLFYDQSHMIKDFKKLTKLNPNSFFKNVDVEKENIWFFI